MYNSTSVTRKVLLIRPVAPDAVIVMKPVNFDTPFEVLDTEPEMSRDAIKKRLYWPTITRKPTLRLEYSLQRRVAEYQAQIRRGLKTLPWPNHAALNHSRILHIRR